MNLDEALDAYWSAAYAEGVAGATHDTPDGRAQCALEAVRSCVRMTVAAERERLAQRCEEVAAHNLTMHTPKSVARYLAGVCRVDPCI